MAHIVSCMSVLLRSCVMFLNKFDDPKFHNHTKELRAIFYQITAAEDLKVYIKVVNTCVYKRCSAISRDLHCV